ncbi:MAG: hypothetical protein E7231_10185 [Cellulosilyticum sp.]|nr:hypothetical protein [Cellulosilyticum sp.]
MEQNLPILKDYVEVIRQLPAKYKYTKEELLIPDLLVEESGQIALYYAAHNESFNRNAKIFMIGITPGFAQMEKSIVACKKALEENKPLEEIPYLCKKEGRFAGALRKNISQMLDEIGLNQCLQISSTMDLFDAEDYLMHTTSLIPYPTFVKGKNYTGHTPELIKNAFLMQYVRANIDRQVEMLKDALYVPMGRCVEEVLKLYIEEGKLKEEQCLIGFPHPSGANVNRKKQFEEEKEQMMNKVQQFYL